MKVNFEKFESIDNFLKIIESRPNNKIMKNLKLNTDNISRFKFKNEPFENILIYGGNPSSLNGICSFCLRFHSSNSSSVSNLGI